MSIEMQEENKKLIWKNKLDEKLWHYLTEQNHSLKKGAFEFKISDLKTLSEFRQYHEDVLKEMVNMLVIGKKVKKNDASRIIVFTVDTEKAEKHYQEVHKEELAEKKRAERMKKDRRKTSTMIIPIGEELEVEKSESMMMEKKRESDRGKP